jgi:hypothetical protein
MRDGLCDCRGAINGEKSLLPLPLPLHRHKHSRFMLTVPPLATPIATV